MSNPFAKIVSVMDALKCKGVSALLRDRLMSHVFSGVQQCQVIIVKDITFVSVDYDRVVMIVTDPF